MKSIKLILAFVFLAVTLLNASTSERDLGNRPQLDMEKVHTYIIEFTNQERYERGLKSLKADKILNRAARLHNQFLVRYKQLIHYGKKYRLPKDRVLAACEGDTDCLKKYYETGTGMLVGCCGENIIESFALTTNGVPYSIHRDKKGQYRVWIRNVTWFDEKTLAKDMVQRWMDSPPHRKIILLKNYKVIGVDVLWDNDERYYGTQVFAPLRN